MLPTAFETTRCRFPKINRGMVTSEGAIDYFGVGKRHGAVSDLALLSMVISRSHSHLVRATGIDMTTNKNAVGDFAESIFEPLNCFFEARLTPNLLLWFGKNR